MALACHELPSGVQSRRALPITGMDHPVPVDRSIVRGRQVAQEIATLWR